MDKKTTAILALLVLLAITGTGWLSASLRPVPHDTTYEWTRIFHGYRAYLDRRISHATMIGTSMEPTIREGDTVLWVGVDNKTELGVGDIIIYEHPTLIGHPIVAHRIVEVGAGGFWTRGDNEIGRQWVPEDRVRGLVIGVIYRKGVP